MPRSEAGPLQTERQDPRELLKQREAMFAAVEEAAKEVPITELRLVLEEILFQNPRDGFELMARLKFAPREVFEVLEKYRVHPGFMLLDVKHYGELMGDTDIVQTNLGETADRRAAHRQMYPLTYVERHPLTQALGKQIHEYYLPFLVRRLKEMGGVEMEESNIEWLERGQREGKSKAEQMKLTEREKGVRLNEAMFEWIDEKENARFNLVQTWPFRAWFLEKWLNDPKSFAFGYDGLREQEVLEARNLVKAGQPIPDKVSKEVVNAAQREFVLLSDDEDAEQVFTQPDVTDWKMFDLMARVAHAMKFEMSVSDEALLEKHAVKHWDEDNRQRALKLVEERMHELLTRLDEEAPGVVRLQEDPETGVVGLDVKKQETELESKGDALKKREIKLPEYDVEKLMMHGFVPVQREETKASWAKHEIYYQENAGQWGAVGTDDFRFHTLNRFKENTSSLTDAEDVDGLEDWTGRKPAPKEIIQSSKEDNWLRVWGGDGCISRMESPDGKAVEFDGSWKLERAIALEDGRIAIIEDGMLMVGDGKQQALLQRINPELEISEFGFLPSAAGRTVDTIYVRAQKVSHDELGDGNYSGGVVQEQILTKNFDTDGSDIKNSRIDFPVLCADESLYYVRRLGLGAKQIVRMGRGHAESALAFPHDIMALVPGSVEPIVVSKVKDGRILVWNLNGQYVNSGLSEAKDFSWHDGKMYFLGKMHGEMGLYTLEPDRTLTRMSNVSFVNDDASLKVVGDELALLARLPYSKESLTLFLLPTKKGEKKEESQKKPDVQPLVELLGMYDVLKKNDLNEAHDWQNKHWTDRQAHDGKSEEYAKARASLMLVGALRENPEKFYGQIPASQVRMDLMDLDPLKEVWKKQIEENEKIEKEAALKLEAEKRKQELAARPLSERVAEKAMEKFRKLWSKAELVTAEPMVPEQKQLRSMEPPTVESLLTKQNELQPSDGDPKMGDGKVFMELNQAHHGLMVTGYGGRYDSVKKSWSACEWPEPRLDRELTSPLVAFLPVLPEMREIRLPVGVGSVVTSAMGVTAYGEQIPLSLEKDGHGLRSVKLPEAKAIVAVAYAQEVLGAALGTLEVSQEEYGEFAKKILEMDPRSLDLIPGLPDEMKLFIDSIKSLPPAVRLQAIQTWVMDVGAYDMENGETELRQGLSIGKRVAEMMRRAEMLRANGKLDASKLFAGVCTDYAELTIALCRQAGLMAGLATGLAVRGKEVQTGSGHAIAFVLWPNPDGSVRYVAVDTTPQASDPKQDALLEAIREPSVSEAVEQEKQARKEVKQAKEKAVKGFAEQRGQEEISDVRRLSKAELEQFTVPYLEQTLKEEGVRALRRLVSFLNYGPIKLAPEDVLDKRRLESLGEMLLTEMSQERAAVPKEKMKHGVEEYLEELRKLAATLTVQGKFRDRGQVVDALQRVVTEMKERLPREEAVGLKMSLALVGK